MLENLEKAADAKFQFLLGTLKTTRNALGLAGDTGFQFLLGTLKT